MSYALRSACDADKAWLEGLRRAVYQDLFKATWGGWDEARHTRQFREFWQHGQISVIEIDGEPVGIIQVFEFSDSVEVGEIQILPSFQNQGIGRQVLRDIIDAAHKLQKSVLLSLGLKNEAAYRLYKSLGFREVGRSDTHIHMSCIADE